jgi:ABC-2 type transport system permease protein
MSTSSYALRDSVTMLRRQLVHMVRYPIVLFLIGIPVIILLLFVYVFGGTMGAGLAGMSGGRTEYLAYVVPGILLIAVASGAQMTAISVAMDMTEGIIARFRTMSISRSSVLAGHVLSSMLQTMASMAVVIGVALLIGFRPAADAVHWIGAIGLLTMVAFSVTWLSVALGLVTKSVETASNLPMPLMLLPFLGSGFVPTASLPVGLRWFAEYQPFTPMIETLRALLAGTAIGQSGLVATVWCAGIALAGYLWARRLYERDPVAR